MRTSAVVKREGEKRLGGSKKERGGEAQQHKKRRRGEAL